MTKPAFRTSFPGSWPPHDERPWREESLELAAQCWCDPETEHLTMDPVLAKAVALRIERWIDTAALNERNTFYYRNLLDECAKALGPDVYLCDDDSISEDPLLSKVPHLVRQFTEHLKHAESELTRLGVRIAWQARP